MTPLGAAKAHCDNYQPDGSCLGMACRGDLSMYRFSERGFTVPSLPRRTMLVFRGDYRADALGAARPGEIACQCGKRLPAEAPASIACSLLP
jgi:hypothetical protein